MSYNFPLPLSNSDKEFIAEIIKSNGENSTAHVWALESINEKMWRQINVMKGTK